MKSPLILCAGLLGALLCATPILRAEVSELRITKQPGLSYLPTVIAEQRKLVEKHAKAAGMPDLKVTWTQLASGGAGNDALLAGQVDMVVSGGPNMLILWAKTNTDVKGIVCTGALPMQLVTNNPAIKTLADFKDTDRISLPTPKVGTQPVVLGIAAEKAFGKAGVERFNGMCVALGHPDGFLQLTNKSGNITASFLQPPFQNLALKQPGISKVLDSVDVMGGPLTNGCVYGTTKFHDANPKVTKAFIDGMKEAIDLVNKDKKSAAEIYLNVNKEKLTVDELAAMLAEPNMVFSPEPKNLLKAAQFFNRYGIIKQDPKSWKEFFFAEVHDLPGS